MTKQFKVGDKVRVLDVSKIDGGYAHYYSGQVTEVVDIYHGYPRLRNKIGERGVVVTRSEFEAIELIAPKPKKPNRMAELEARVDELERQLAKLQSKKTTVHNVSINAPSAANGSEIIEKYKEILAKLNAAILTPNERRKATIERSKAFVTYKQPLGGRRVEYVINAEKRTVVAIAYSVSFGFKEGIYAKGIAKCAPDDVFNADIGKAIALGRALGVDVSDFENAVKPTEVVVGMKAEIRGNIQPYVKTIISNDTGRYHSVESLNRNNDRLLRIIEDTEAQY